MAPRSTRPCAGLRWASLPARLGNGIRSYELSVADGESALETLVADWRRLHDRYADLMAGVLAFVAQAVR